jgi:secreted trypsin-like serine protease
VGPGDLSFDADVIHLASPVNGIAPVQLVTPGVDALERPGTLATVTGWGNTIQQPAGPGYIQAGITSWGIGCGATGFPGVSTRLGNRGVGNFILSITGGVPVTAAQAA